VLYAVLVCSSRRCEIPYEAWGERRDLERLDCEDCGHPLDILAFSKVERERAASGSVELQQRDAA
jgi:hypothetical protein